MARRTGRHPFSRVGAWPEDREHVQDSTLGYYAPAIDPSVCIRSHVTIDAGVERPTTIGARTFVMAHVHVGHDCLVGDEVELATGCVLGGYSEIADRAKIGINATILPYRKVGADAVVGAGAVVTEDVPAGATVVGNPARRLLRRNSVPHSERGSVPPPSLPYEMVVTG